jgi:acyl-homoserine-lactone acylase
VRQVTVEDAVRLFHMLALYASSYELAPLVAAADPDTMVASRALPPQEELAHMLYAATDPEKVREALGLPSAEALGSNAYAVGADASQTNAGILLGNPHFPWQRNRRFFMFHLTMGDEYDVMGGALIGAPIPLIGFNRNLAWSHTVSTAQRFTFYELTLNPDNKMQYLYDGEYRDITSRTVTVGRKAADGSVESVEHTLYFSHYGPIADLGAINSLGAGWPNAFGSLVSYRDANLENMRLLEEFLQMGQARDLGEFKQALRAMGLPWVNTIAADRYGDAFYGDVSTTPNTSIAKIRNCVRGVAQNFLTDSGVLTMDGSDSSCEWGNDPDTAPGVLGYDNMPKLDTRQYAANANDSYWLPNPRHLITGYPKVIGREEVEQSLRTRHTFDQAEMRLAGSDGLGAPGFNVDNIRQLHYQAANYAAGLVLDDVLGICRAQEDDPLAGISQVQEACTVLSAWDRSHRIDSVGAHIFTEFWRVMRETPDMFATPFDPADPVHTPRALKVDDPAVVAAVQDALLQAVERLAAAGIPLDRPWGEVQFVEKNGVRYGIHGGSGGMMFNVITSDLVDGEGYSNITHGNSYMQAVTWDESDCPDAYVMLTYSQSTDPASAHYADATALYSSSGWIDVPFCRAEQDAQELGRETISE